MAKRELTAAELEAIARIRKSEPSAAPTPAPPTESMQRIAKRKAEALAELKRLRKYEEDHRIDLNPRGAREGSPLCVYPSGRCVGL